MKASRWLPLLTVCLASLLTGCGNFFQGVSSSSGSGSSGSSSTSGYFYVGNTTSTTLAGYSLNTSSSLTAVTNSPYSESWLFGALAITPGNTFLYAAAPSLTQVYVFSVASDGSLTIGNSGTPVASGVYVSSMKVDTTGKWLILADALSGDVFSYPINTSTGALSLPVSSIPLNITTTSGNTGVPNSILITPSDSVVYVSLGIAGVDILTLNSSTGVLASYEHLKTLDSTGSTNKDQGMATDSNGKYLFLTETVSNSVRVLTIGTNGHLAEISGSPFTVGSGPIAAAVDPTDAYLYVANYGSGTVSAFSIGTAGALTAISGSPFTTGSTPVDLAFDKTKTYLVVACSGGSPDVQLFKLDSTTAGKLDSVATATTGASSAAGRPASLAVARYQ